MAFLSSSFLLSLVLAYAAGLQCYSCDGHNDCQETEVCDEHQDQCSTTIMTLLALLDTLTARGRRGNVLQCYSCSSTDQNCVDTKATTMLCAQLEENCVDITSFTTFQEFLADEQRIKGCGLLSHCEKPLGFHNQNSFYFIKCCNTSYCNNDMTDYKSNPMPLNGVTCYSCEGNATHGCSEGDITKLQCQGPMTQCLEASGIHSITGQNSVLKGCASPSWCDSPYTSVYKNMGVRYSRCCSGDLCNNQIVNGSMKPASRSHAGYEVSAQQTLLSIIVLVSLSFLLSAESS
uniref:UPAR/Ly6 domain-containing protein n=1 Tax=Salvator merianae TaxID=96440 RepID=A0A8D0BLA5_SALMN